MTPLAGLLDACRTEPDDPTNFLVLGDWLMDQDDPATRARGELVHLQCGPEDGPDRGRIDQLLREHAATWRRGLEGYRVTFLRGLVSVEIHGDDLPALGDELPPGWDWVSEVSLSLGTFTAPGVRRLASWPGLSRIGALGMDRCGCTDRDAALFPEFPDMPALRRVSLYDNDIRAAGARALAESPCLDRVRVLNLGRNVVGTEGARALAGAMYLRGLEQIDLRMNGICDEGALSLYRSPLRARLTRINLVGNGILREEVRRLWRGCGMKVEL